jgi:hypothetical protein
MKKSAIASIDTCRYASETASRLKDMLEVLVVMGVSRSLEDRLEGLFNLGDFLAAVDTIRNAVARLTISICPEAEVDFAQIGCRPEDQEENGRAADCRGVEGVGRHQADTPRGACHEVANKESTSE